jgi:hypothetical protein
VGSLYGSQEITGIFAEETARRATQVNSPSTACGVLDAAAISETPKVKGCPGALTLHIGLFSEDIPTFLTNVRTTDSAFPLLAQCRILYGGFRNFHV